MTNNENIGDVAFNFLFMALNQINEVKNKIDPEVKEKLMLSATDAISSARNFLDALDCVVEQLKSAPEIEDVKDNNVFDLQNKKAQ